MSVLTLRVLADTSSGERVKRYDPVTGAPYLADPATWDLDDRSTWVEQSWPCLGAVPDGEPPARTTISTTVVDRGVAAGWIELIGEHLVHRPGGAAAKPWGTVHTFRHAEAIVIKGPESEVRYRVVEQPDKYHQGPEGTDAIADPEAEVRHFYALELEG